MNIQKDFLEVRVSTIRLLFSDRAVARTALK